MYLARLPRRVFGSPSLPSPLRTSRPMSSNGCCGGNAPARAPTAAQASGEVASLAEAVRMGDSPSAVADTVKEYYGEVLTATEDLKTSACCTAVAPPPAIRSALSRVPDEVVSKYYGCGSPFPEGLTGSGLRVLDLGSGSGRDCYVAAALVGASGSVTGVDMTLAQLDVARRHVDTYCKDTLGYKNPNMKFVEGRIEDLGAAGIKDASIDLIISNCVVNLSADKAAVLSEAYRVLAPGGEMFFSDVYADRRLLPAARTHPVLVGECLGGALYDQDFLRLARAAGFEDPRRLNVPTPIEVKDPELEALLGGARFYSITYRLFKLPGSLESLCEDYGQAAKYKGSINESPVSQYRYVLDDHHVFEAGKWYEVCGNTAAMVGDSWLGKHFEIVGGRERHYGVFSCGAAPAPVAGEGVATGACC
jgi:arsenite methyltransferase